MGGRPVTAEPVSSARISREAFRLAGSKATCASHFLITPSTASPPTAPLKLIRELGLSSDQTGAAGGAEADSVRRGGGRGAGLATGAGAGGRAGAASAAAGQRSRASRVGRRRIGLLIPDSSGRAVVPKAVSCGWRPATLQQAGVANVAAEGAKT